MNSRLAEYGLFPAADEDAERTARLIRGTAQMTQGMESQKWLSNQQHGMRVDAMRRAGDAEVHNIRMGLPVAVRP